MFETIRNEKTRKFLDLKLWLQDVQGVTSDDFSKSCKGLFFVYVYGLLEYVVTSTIRESIQELNSKGICINDCSFDLINIVLEPYYKMIKTVGRDKKWEKRWAIADDFKNGITITITDDTFPTDGKNIRYKQIESLCKSFGIKSPFLPRPDVRGYLEQVADNRNYIEMFI